MSDERFKLAVKLASELQRAVGTQHTAGYVGISDLQTALSRAGLALVPAADVLMPEERAVLEAVASIPDSELRSRGNWYGYAKKVGDAEAARRAGKKSSDG